MRYSGTPTYTNYYPMHTVHHTPSSSVPTCSYDLPSRTPTSPHLKFFAMASHNSNVIILKIGGSSITNKAKEETLDLESLNWFAKLISKSVDESLLAAKTSSAIHSTRSTKPKLIVVHGAGSFGHHSAKRYGLRCGKSALLDEIGGQSSPVNVDVQSQMEGLSKTRQQVQKLNSAIVGALIDQGVNAVGISPGMSIPNIRAHGATKRNGNADSSYGGMQLLCQSIHQSLDAGLVPVVHGDACLLYDNKRAGILGGDTLVEGIANLWNESVNTKDNASTHVISKVVFITDVAGVFTSDPKSNKNAILIRHLNVDCTNGEVRIADDDAKGTNLDVGGSSHAHDVTGGLKVRFLQIAFGEGGLCETSFLTNTCVGLKSSRQNLALL